MWMIARRQTRVVAEKDGDWDAMWSHLTQLPEKAAQMSLVELCRCPSNRRHSGSFRVLDVHAWAWWLGFLLLFRSCSVHGHAGHSAGIPVWSVSWSHSNANDVGSSLARDLRSGTNAKVKEVVR